MSYYYQVDLRSADDTVSFDRKASLKALPDAVRRLQTSARGDQDVTAWTDADSTLAPDESSVVLDQRGPGALRRLQLDVDVSALDSIAL
jgi:hypothetical protein